MYFIGIESGQRRLENETRLIKLIRFKKKK